MQGPTVTSALESHHENPAVLRYFKLGQIVFEGCQPTGGQKSSKALHPVRVRLEGGFQTFARFRKGHRDYLLEIAVSHCLRQASDVGIDLGLGLSEVGRGEVRAPPVRVDFLTLARQLRSRKR